jgi:hypothetical protein
MAGPGGGSEMPEPVGLGDPASPRPMSGVSGDSRARMASLAVFGGPGASGQATTIRASTVTIVEENEGLRPYIRHSAHGEVIL